MEIESLKNKTMESLKNKTMEEIKAEFEKKSHMSLDEAQTRFNEGVIDNKLMKTLQHTMILADEESIEWHQAKRMLDEIKQKQKEENERRQKNDAAMDQQNKENKSTNMKKLHFGTIEYNGFFDKKNNLRSFAFITMIDGYKRVVYGNEDYDEKNIGKYDNENWDDDEHDTLKPTIKKQVFFHIKDKGQGEIDTLLDTLRSDERWSIEKSIGVVFEIESTSKGKKAVNVITIADAFSNTSTIDFIRETIKVDVNVYFLVMDQVPDLFSKFLVNDIYEKIWKYKEYDDHIELTGADLIIQNGTGGYRWFPYETVILPSYILGKPVTSISPAAFIKIARAENYIIPETVSYIGEGAFKGAYFRKLLLPSNVKVIEPHTFEGCQNTEEMIIELPEQLTEIREKAFAESSLQYISIPPSVKKIGNQAFSKSELVSIELPVSLNSVGERVFSDCKNLKRVSFSKESKLKKIEKEMFKGCEELTFVHLNPGIEVIGEGAFYDCKELPIDLFPDTVVSINRGALGCNKMNHWSDRTIAIPSSAIDIQENAWGSETIVRVSSGSYAEAYCKEKNLKYVY